MLKKLPGAILFAAVCAGLAAAWYAGLLSPLYANYPDRAPLGSQQPNYDVTIIAHRGHELVAPENTMSSFMAAIDAGVEFIEVDIRVSADGVPVVVHDDTVDRTTDGEGGVRTKTLAELRQLDAGSWYSPDFVGERIPTLEQVLEASLGNTCIFADFKGKPNRVTLQMLKAFNVASGGDCVIASMKADLSTSKFPMEKLDPVEREKLEMMAARRVESYNDQMRVFNRYWPDFPRVVAWGRGDDIAELAAANPNAVALSVIMNAVDAELVRVAHSHGLMVISRIPDADGRQDEFGDPYYKRLTEAGVDAIFLTDFVNLRRYLAEQRAAASE